MRRTHFPEAHLIQAVFENGQLPDHLSHPHPCPNSPTVHSRADFQINRAHQSCSECPHSRLPGLCSSSSPRHFHTASSLPRDIPSRARRRAAAAQPATGIGSPQRREKVPRFGAGGQIDPQSKGKNRAASHPKQLRDPEKAALKGEEHLSIMNLFHF